MDEDEPYPTGNIKLYPCDNCGRKFKQESLGKHRSACKTLSKPKRKVFDSGKQRAEGSDVIYSKTKETKKVQIMGERPDNVNQNSNWREKHEQFLKSVRQARNISEAIKTGAPIPKFEPSSVPSDYVNCQYCGRNFNKTAAERHIPFCETQSKRQKINNSANQKFNTKSGINPRAPLPNQQLRKQSSEAYRYQNNQDNYNSNSYISNRPNYATAGSGSGGGSGGGGGYGKGYSNVSSGNERKPIKYDSSYYYESDNQDSGGGYSMKNKAPMANQRNSKQPDLRTGRNVTNSELNALARNRSGNNVNSQKESPMNSRDPSTKRQQQNGAPRVGGYARANQQQHNEQAGGPSKFCHECGSEFPVQWARFCSYCGDRRL